ncbi:MAG: LysR family transcriptional regulator [Alphaproteobacteria bacterium]|nr:MAG: LysR family transcriptional regulator [Alphaproteobacteria bacterium]
MQTRSLETLVRIHQVQSFSRAAELQNMTLSALSMQMKALETRLGVQLFDRSFRPPKLTPLGRRIAQQARRVVEQQRLLTGLCGQAGGLVGLFRLGVISSVAVRLLPGFLRQSAERAPQASFEISIGLSEHLGEQVRLGLVDAAVVTRVPGPAQGLAFETIGREEMALAVPAAHAGTPTGALPRRLPFIHFRPSSGIGRLIARSLENLAEPPRRTIILDSLEASVEFVKAGLGYTLLPLPDIARCADARVHVHAGRPQAMYRELALVSRRDTPHGAWVAHVADGFRQVIAPETDDG